MTDPNRLLEQVRDLARLVTDEGLLPESLAEHGPALATAFTVLDDFLSRGGRVPDAWEASSRATLRVALTDQLQRLLEPVGWPEVSS